MPHTIDEYAFQLCSKLASINLPKGLKAIGFGAFNFCTSLKEITIPASVTNIRQLAFNRCDDFLKVSILSPDVTIERDAFRKCNLVIIYAYEGSAGEVYAKANKMPLVLLK